MPESLKKSKKVEDKLMRVIAKKFGFKYPFSPELKVVDRAALEAEWGHFIKGEVGVIERMSPEEAKAQFIKRFSVIMESVVEGSLT